MTSEETNLVFIKYVMIIQIVIKVFADNEFFFQIISVELVRKHQSLVAIKMRDIGSLCVFHR